MAHKGTGRQGGWPHDWPDIVLARLMREHDGPPINWPLTYDKLCKLRDAGYWPDGDTLRFARKGT